MIRPSRFISGAFAKVGFAVLFPGYLLYHYAVASHWIPPFAGGLFGVAAAVLAAMAILALPWASISRHREPVGGLILGAVTLAYFLAWPAANFLVDSQASYSWPALTESIGTVAVWIAVMVVGYFVDLEDPATRRTVATMYGLCLVALIHAMLVYRSPQGPYFTFASQGEGEAALSTYQGVGRSLLVTGLMFAASLRSSTKRILVLFATAGALATIGSRAEFAAMLVVCGVASIHGFGTRGRAKMALALAALVTIAATSFLPFLASTRNAELLNLATSTSWQARREFTDETIHAIRSDPVIGDYAFHHKPESSGGYAHNALSAWVGYGLIGFVLFVGQTAGVAILAFHRVFLRRTATSAWIASLYVGWATLFLIVAAIPVYHALPAFSWAVGLAALRTERRNRIESAASNEAVSKQAGSGSREEVVLLTSAK